LRPRDPRRLLARRREARAHVELLEQPESGHAPGGAVTSRQLADVTLPREELDRIWTPEYLERLGATYWRFLKLVSLGLLRVLYTEDSRAVVFLTRPFVLIEFFAPEYEIQPDSGSITWRISKGLLVAPKGRGEGYLRLSVRRHGDTRVTVSSEVANFYPMIAGWGWFSRIGRALYRATQLQLHTIVTNAFLRSLAALDLVPSTVGRLRTQLERESAIR
jgi:hypothetical protein